MAHMQNIEVLIKEYLAYRGFTSCLKTFETECRNDKTKSFRVDKILEIIQLAINSSDLQELRDIWKNLDNFFFSKLEQNYSDAVKKLETGKFYSNSSLTFCSILFYSQFNRTIQSLSRSGSKKWTNWKDQRVFRQNGTRNPFFKWLARLVLLPILQKSWRKWNVPNVLYKAIPRHALSEPSQLSSHNLSIDAPSNCDEDRKRVISDSETSGRKRKATPETSNCSTTATNIQSAALVTPANVPGEEEPTNQQSKWNFTLRHCSASSPCW